MPRGTHRTTLPYIALADLYKKAPHECTDKSVESLIKAKVESPHTGAAGHAYEHTEEHRAAYERNIFSLLSGGIANLSGARPRRILSTTKLSDKTATLKSYLETDGKNDLALAVLFLSIKGASSARLRVKIPDTTEATATVTTLADDRSFEKVGYYSLIVDISRSGAAEVHTLIPIASEPGAGELDLVSIEIANMRLRSAAEKEKFNFTRHPDKYQLDSMSRKAKGKVSIGTPSRDTTYDIDDTISDDNTLRLLAKMRRDCDLEAVCKAEGRESATYEYVEKYNKSYTTTGEGAGGGSSKGKGKLAALHASKHKLRTGKPKQLKQRKEVTFKAGDRAYLSGTMEGAAAAPAPTVTGKRAKPGMGAATAHTAARHRYESVATPELDLAALLFVTPRQEQARRTESEHSRPFRGKSSARMRMGRR